MSRSPRPWRTRREARWIRSTSDMLGFDLRRRLVAEALGTGLLVATVVGSGIMAAKLAGDLGALALLCNTIPTGAILAVLITVLAPVSGAHFNPAVSAALALRASLPAGELLPYVLAQIAGGIAGSALAHGMFDLPLVQFSVTARIRHRPVARRGDGRLRTAADHLRLRRGSTQPLCRGASDSTSPRPTGSPARPASRIRR